MSKTLGALGEGIVKTFFERQGWRCCDHNVFFREGELDVVLKKGRRLLFVEVKTRRRSDWDRYFPRMSFQKIKRYKIATFHYLRKHPCKGFELLVAYVTLDAQAKRATLKIMNLKDFF